MIGSIFFIFNRLVEIVFLIPIIGMLVRSNLGPTTLSKRKTNQQAYFVDGFIKANQLTPSYILVLFIVSVLAVFWCIDTLIRLSTTKRSSMFVAFIDLCFFGAFIAGVYQLRFIADADCGGWDGGPVIISLGPFGAWGVRTDNPLAFHLDKTCAMLKTCFALGIMEVVFFMWTAIIAMMLHRGHKDDDGDGRRRGHGSRRGHSGSRHRRSSSRRRHYVV